MKGQIHGRSKVTRKKENHDEKVKGFNHEGWREEVSHEEIRTSQNEQKNGEESDC